MFMSVLFLIAATLVTASWAYWAATWICLHNLFARGGSPECTPALIDSTILPPVSILKPAGLIDEHTLDNFATFCSQDYPSYELLIGVLQVTAGAQRVLETLQHRFPNCSIRLVPASDIGLNPKSSVLLALAREARHELLVISDSDIRVENDYLRRVTTPLADANVGLVTCPFRTVAPHRYNLPASLEALYLDATFIPSAVVGAAAGACLGFGATMALRRSDLHRIGGYAAIKDHLADDYQIASRLAALGWRVRLSNYVVLHILGPSSFSELWRRQLRWMRSVRVSSNGYWGLPLTFSTPLALCAAAVAPSRAIGGAFVAISLAIRWITAGYAMTRLGRRPQLRTLLLLPAIDCINPLAWCAAAMRRRIRWRAHSFLVLRDGQLRPCRPRRGLVTPLVLWIDVHLRRRRGIYEFSDDPTCLLRVSLEPSPHDAQLADGTRIARGEQILMLHLWNDHLCQISRNGASIAWAVQAKSQFRRSLVHLARHIDATPDLRSVRAIRGRCAFMPRNGSTQLRRMTARYGLELLPCTPPTLYQRIHDFWENLLLLGLAWTFGTGQPRLLRFTSPRYELWISRQNLLRLHGHIPQASPTNNDAHSPLHPHLTHGASQPPHSVP